MKQNKGRRIIRKGVGSVAALSVITALVFGTSACSGGSSGSSSSAISAVMIETVEPAVGTNYGGTVVTISGEGFSLGNTPSTVRFGSLFAADVNIIDDNTLTAKVPAGAAGASVTITVQNTAGRAVRTGGFRYLVPAPITSDLNDDGIADLVISAPLADFGGRNAGAVHVFFGSLGVQADTMASDADVTIVGFSTQGRFGTSVLTGDLNGDGFDDIAVGAPMDDANGDDNGAVYIFDGPLESNLINATDANHILTGEAGHMGDLFGTALAFGDVDDDGRVDLVVSAIRDDAGGIMTDCGAVYTFLDSATLANVSADQADAKVIGVEDGDQLGNMILIGDVNADGADDLVVSAVRFDPPLPVPRRQDAGGVFIFLGGSAPAVDANSADIILTGEDVGDEFGAGLAVGDIDGDGVKDVMVGAPKNDRLGFDVGRVYMFKGGATLASAYAPEADVILSGQPSNDNFGETLTCGDTNGDGMDDIVIGAPRASHGAIHNGRSFVFNGSTEMVDGVATMADMIQTGEPSSHEAFGTCTKVADWNRDGMADVLVSAPGNDGNGPSSGRVYVFRGAQFGGDSEALESDVMLTGDAPGSLLGTMIANGQ